MSLQDNRTACNWLRESQFYKKIFRLIYYTYVRENMLRALCRLHRRRWRLEKSLKLISPASCREMFSYTVCVRVCTYCTYVHICIHTYTRTVLYVITAKNVSMLLHAAAGGADTYLQVPIPASKVEKRKNSIRLERVSTMRWRLFWPVFAFFSLWNKKRRRVGSNALSFAFTLSRLASFKSGLSRKFCH